MKIILEIKVMPSSGKQKIVRDASGALKCYIISAPEKGKANNELIAYLAKLLGLKKGDLEILSGATSQKKRLLIQGIATHKELYEKLGVEAGGQHAIF